MATIHGVIRGRTIELQEEPGLPDGQAVAVSIQQIEAAPATTRPEDIPPVESWADRLIFDPTVEPIERIVKGTRLRAETLVSERDKGRSDEEMVRAHPELSVADLEALRHYARWPVGLRRSCGGWTEDAEELDNYLEWTRQHRKIRRRKTPALGE